MRFSQLASQFRVGQSLVEHLADEFASAFPISGRLTIIEPERLLIQIAKQMEGFDANISSFEAAFEQAPETFQVVSVDVAIHVFDGVINNRVLVVSIQAF